MTSADALFYALWVPGQVVVDNKGAELQVDALCSGLRGDHDLGFVPKVLYEGRADVHDTRAGRATRLAIGLHPALIDGRGLGFAVGAVEGEYAPGVPIGLEEALQVLLRPTRLGEDDCLLSRAHLRHSLEAHLQSRH